MYRRNRYSLVSSLDTLRKREMTRSAKTLDTLDTQFKPQSQGDYTLRRICMSLAWAVTQSMLTFNKGRSGVSLDTAVLSYIILLTVTTMITTPTVATAVVVVIAITTIVSIFPLAIIVTTAAVGVVTVVEVVARIVIVPG